MAKLSLSPFIWRDEIENNNYFNLDKKCNCDLFTQKYLNTLKYLDYKDKLTNKFTRLQFCIHFLYFKITICVTKSMFILLNSLVAFGYHLWLSHNAFQAVATNNEIRKQ